MLTCSGTCKAKTAHKHQHTYTLNSIHTRGMSTFAFSSAAQNKKCIHDIFLCFIHFQFTHINAMVSNYCVSESLKRHTNIDLAMHMGPYVVIQTERIKMELRRQKCAARRGLAASLVLCGKHCLVQLHSGRLLLCVPNRCNKSKQHRHTN